MPEASAQRKPLHWVGSSRADIRQLPEGVRDVFGFALGQAQRGEKHLDAKPLKGLGGASVLEVVADAEGSTYRAVYTVRFRWAIYVLHVFQKKSRRGIATPQKEIETIKARLRLAAEHYQENYEER
ncbi:MAG TPA: type II toxin-antitoxin system RelE/ParE family toxin [Tepidisphaeraceae bacterium]|nr:type II toxin-antitoxin system RelE/ParE family toxin [Tepidisphaeraceae bacterium]